MDNNSNNTGRRCQLAPVIGQSFGDVCHTYLYHVAGPLAQAGGLTGLFLYHRIAERIPYLYTWSRFFIGLPVGSAVGYTAGACAPLLMAVAVGAVVSRNPAIQRYMYRRPGPPAPPMY